MTKRTEADMGITRFMGFVLEDNGELFPLSETPNRRIEFIGNSITCGYGTEGNNKDERFKPDTENNCKSYAAILARAFSADAHFIAHSGKGLVRNYDDKKSVFDTHDTMPDAITAHSTVIRHKRGILAPGNRIVSSST